MLEQSCTTWDELRRLVTPARNRYFYGKLLTERHFELEQSYFNRKRWLLNRLGLGMGVLCGLHLKPLAGGRISIGRGAAIDGVGHEIIVPYDTPIDPHKLTDDCGNQTGERVDDGHVYISLCYHECGAEPAPILVSGCESEHDCAPSITRERYRLLVHREPHRRTELITDEQCAAIFSDALASTRDRYATACETLQGPCLPDEDSDICVPLAKITIDDDLTIDECAVRPVLYSNAMLFEMILCLAARVDGCCTSDMPRVMATWPANSQRLDRTNVNRLIERGIEITFNHRMSGNQLSGPAAWLGLWMINLPEPGQPRQPRQPPQPPCNVMRIKLTPISQVPLPLPDSSTVSYRLDLAVPWPPNELIQRKPIFLLIMDAHGDNIVDTSAPTPLLLDAEFKGAIPDPQETGLSVADPTAPLIRALWSIPFDQQMEFSADLPSRIPLPGGFPALPAQGSGDGKAGGIFVLTFSVE